MVPFTKKSSTYRLYLKRKEGGRGLISVTDCVTQEVIGLTSYVHESKAVTITWTPNMHLYFIQNLGGGNS